MIKSDAAVILTLRYNPDISLGFKRAFAEYKRRLKAQQGMGRDPDHLPGGSAVKLNQCNRRINDMAVL